MSKVDLSIELVINYLESEHITVGTPEIKNLVIKWHEILPTIDFISLAAIVLYNPNKNVLSDIEIREIRKYFFP